tara:strand:+ start:347 stop:1030 length:684 start_codon:yes stop_codon:yes gene_type:complete
MFKISKLLILIILTIVPFSANSHVEHYKNLNLIEFDIYRNGKHIGKHIFSFKKDKNKVEVESKIDFQIKKLGVVLYKYRAKGLEVYEDGKLVKFNSKTNQNKKEKYVNIKLDKDKYIIDGSSYKGDAPDDYLIGTWWNHSLVKAEAQISAVSGRIIKQKVTFVGNEKIKIGDKTYNTLHFNFSSLDKKLPKNKKLNTDVWYDEITLNWVKASFNKSGKWEYKLINVQ